ncbi:ABC transporter permease [Arcanobacterium hippocoleae]
MNMQVQVNAQTTAASASLRKISWKLPITFTFATLLLGLFAIKANGDTLLRLNDAKQKITIPDFSLPASMVLWVFFALAGLITIYAYFSAVSKGKFGKLEKRLDTAGAIIVALLTVLGFMIFAGAGSAGAVTITSTLVSTIAISTPLIFGALSGVICEHVGVVNIAIEGQLLVGAFAGAMAASFFQNPFAGLLLAPIMGALLGVLLALFSVVYGVDQIIVGVVLNVLALGLTTFFAGTLMSDNAALFNTNKYSLQALPIPGLSQIPVIGPALFNQTILVYSMYITVIVLTIFLYRSRWGLRMRACGEHPRAADTVGINVNRTRFLNTILGSAVAGLGGAFFTIGSGLIFTDNMAAGNGYIALAAMILGKWHPIGAVGAALMFGFAKALALLVPNLTTAIPSQLVNMIPYVVTIIAVAGFVGKSRPPAAENIPYLK